MSIKRALVSVSDKQGIVDFCRELSALGVEIISTGGTSTLLAKEGVPVIGISDVTGFGNHGWTCQNLAPGCTQRIASGS